MMSIYAMAAALCSLLIAVLGETITALADIQGLAGTVIHGAGYVTAIAVALLGALLYVIRPVPLEVVDEQEDPHD